MYHYGDRYYNSAQRRWTQQDSVTGTLVNPNTMNRYAYIGGDPLNQSDPTGHDVLSNALWGCVEVGFAGAVALILVPGGIAVGGVLGCGVGAAAGSLLSLFDVDINPFW